MPGRLLEMILGLVAPFSQSVSSFRATATHFVSKTMNFVRPQSLKHINGTYKILILDDVRIANTKYMYCKYRNIVEMLRLYIANIEIVCSKYKI